MKLPDEIINERDTLSKKYTKLATEFTAITDQYRADMRVIGDRLREIAQMERDDNAGTGTG